MEFADGVAVRRRRKSYHHGITLAALITNAVTVSLEYDEKTCLNEVTNCSKRLITQLKYKMIWKFKSAKPTLEMSVLRPFLSRLNKLTTIFHGLYSCTLIEHRNDVKMFKTQVEPRAADEWFHCKVFNIL